MQSYWLRGKATSATIETTSNRYQIVILYSVCVTLQLQICCRYWMDGEPNVDADDACVAVYARENIFKAWVDVECSDENKKWICEKAQEN